MPDLTALDLTGAPDAELEQLRADVLNELERRQRLATVPQQVADLAARYVDDGGDPADLTALLPA